MSSRLTKEELDLVKKAREIVDRDANAPASRAQPLPAAPRDPGGECKFRHARDYLTSVMKACMRPDQPMDERLIPYFSANAEAIREGGTVRKAVGSDEARAISDPYGGFLVPTAFTPELLKLDPEADPIAGKTRQIPMASPIVKIPARTDKNHTTSVSGGLTVTRRPETVAATPSQMQVENVTLEAHSLFGLSYASEELLRDSPISFTAILAAGFSDQFAYHLIKERLYGTGVGEFLGVLTALDASNLGPTVSVARETGQAADTIVYENILKMRARCWGYANAVWLANHDTMPELMRLNQAVGTGGAVVWQPSAREDHPDMLLGRPLYFSEYAKTLGDQGDIGIYNWGEYLEGTYQPMANEESVHVRFVNHERAYKFWTRNSGMPWWRTALTPAYSSAKLSPFVVLDSR